MNHFKSIGIQCRRFYACTTHTTSIFTIKFFFGFFLGKGCGGRFYGLTGTIASPDYPANTRKVSVCRWDITIPKGAEEVLQFSGLNALNFPLCHIVQFNSGSVLKSSSFLAQTVLINSYSYLFVLKVNDRR